MQKPVSDLRGAPVGPPANDVAPPAPRRRPRAGAILGGLLLLGIAVFIILFQWNWLRGPLARYLSHRIHRPVAIAGNLEVHPWSLTPTITANAVTIGEPDWAGAGTMARLPRLTVRIRLLPLFSGQTIFPLVEADRPEVTLFADARGRENWRFGKPGAPPLPIGHLVIRDARVRLAEVGRRLGFAGAVSTDERATRNGVSGGTTITGSLIVGNPPWAGPGPLASAPRLVIDTSLIEAMRHRTAVELLEADAPVIRLVRDASGRENWRSGVPGKSVKAPPIANLVIKDGSLRYDDARRPLHFAGTVSTSERLTGERRGVFELSGSGTLNRSPFRALVTGGALMNVDKSRPWPFDAHIEAGTTKLAMRGAIAHPFDLGRLSGTARMSGEDFSDLYAVTGLALPMTPPYALSAGFSRVGKVYAFRALRGRVGDSDLAGSLSVDDTSGRPFLTAALASRRLRLVDLAPAFGGAPRNTAGHIVSPAEKVISARLRAEHRLLPDTPLNVQKVRGMDARVDYRAASVEAGRLPVHTLAMHLTLDHGVLALDPVSMGLSQGDLAGDVRIDARRAVPFTSMDVRVSNARLGRFTQRGAAPPPLEGGLFARARLAGGGASVRAAAAGANGELSIVVPSGEIRQSLAELMGIDAANGLFLLLTKSQKQTPILCGIADFRAQNGILTAQRIVLDTGVVLVAGTGDIDMRNETFDLRLAGKPKKFRLMRIAAPITVRGDWEAPKFGVDVGKAAGQLAVSGLLGALVSPLALILPFVNPGLAHNADCAHLIAASPAR